MIVNIYALCEPGTTSVRYIGKTIQKPGETARASITRRLKGHMSPWHTKSERHNARWIRLLMRQELTPCVMLIDVGDENTWPALEMFHIAAHRLAGFRLTNMTDGGEGCNGFHHTQAHKDYMAGLMKGRVLSPESLARMAASKRGKPSPNKGVPMSDAQKLKLRGKPKSPEHRLKLSRAKRGRPGHPAWNKGLPAWNRGIPRTEDEKAKIRAANVAFLTNGGTPAFKGRHHTDDSKTRISEARKEFYRNNPITHCAYGHEFTAENTYINPSDGSRHCKECEKTRSAEMRQRRRNGEPKRRSADTVALLSQKATERWATNPRTQCKHGHAYTPENSYYTPKGIRECRICKQNKSKAEATRKKAERAARHADAAGSD